MVSELSGDQTGKVLGVSGPRGVREMRMMEMEGWKPPHTGWKAQDIVEHAKEIFFSEEEIKIGADGFDITVVPGRRAASNPELDSDAQFRI